MTFFSHDFFSFGNYWTITIKPKLKTAVNNVSDEELYGELDRIKNHLKENDKLGIGLAIKQNGKKYDYQFNFILNEVRLYEVSK